MRSREGKYANDCQRCRGRCEVSARSKGPGADVGDQKDQAM